MSNKMSQYTFVLNFRDGIYVSQVESPDIKDAMNKWAINIKPNDIKYMGKANIDELIRVMKEEEPILLSGFSNVWCITGMLKAGFFIANVIKSAV